MFKKEENKTKQEAPKEWHWYQMGASNLRKAEASIARWIVIVISATAIGKYLRYVSYGTEFAAI